MNLNIEKTKEYNNKFLVSNTSMKIGSNRDMNRDHKKLPPTEPGKVEGVVHAKIHLMKSTD